MVPFTDLNFSSTTKQEKEEIESSKSSLRKLSTKLTHPNKLEPQLVFLLILVKLKANTNRKKATNYKRLS